MAEKKTKEEKIQDIEKQKSVINKKIAALNASIPADNKNASAQKASGTKEGTKRGLQFLNKKLADEALKKDFEEQKKELDLQKKELKSEKEVPELEESFKKYNKMAKLTKEQILNIVESSEPARMTKSELIESIIGQIVLSEAMNDDLRRKIESGESDYSEHIDPETIKRMSNEIVDSIKSNLEAKGGRGVANLEGAQSLMAQGLSNALQKERRHKRELEQLAIKLVREEYNVPEDAVDFEAEITGHPQLGGTEIRKERLKMKKGDKRPPQGKTAEELKPNVTKRRLMNAMMHGAARKGQNLFHMASDDLRRIDPSLVQDYSKLMAANDFMYWALDDETIARESESGTHAGQVRVNLSGAKPKIIAQGMTFPFLLHELTKGVLELISLHGLDADKETRDYVLDKTDNLESEPMDIRLGVKVWEKLLETMDVDALPYKAQIFTRMSELPPTEFNRLINGLLNGSEQAKEEAKDLIYDVIRENNEDEVEQAMKQFREPDTDTPETPEGPEGPEGPDDEDDELAKLLGKKGKKEEVDDPRTWSKRELENARDEALDTGNYKMVAFYQTILDEKY